MSRKIWHLWGKPAPSPEDKPVWSTHELAEYLDVHARTVQRWCKGWFDPLANPRHTGPGQGFQIPWQYVYVARAYLLIEHEPTRAKIRTVLAETPRDWVCVVDGLASAHYTLDEATQRMARLKHLATILYVGEYTERLPNGTRPK